LGSYADAAYFANKINRCCRYNRSTGDAIAKGKAINVSPNVGKKKSFSSRNANLWPQYKQAIENADYSDPDDPNKEPDWWYLSGHHAGRVKADGFSWSDGKYYARLGDVGLFNEIYHDIRDPLPTEPVKKDGAIFVTTSVEDNSAFKATAEGTNLLDSQVRPHPLYKSGKNVDCKGILLIGCNTLTFPEERLMYQKFFPNAVMFGYFFAKAPGDKNTQEANMRSIFRAIKPMAPSFFEDPERYLGAGDSLKDIVARLALKTRRRRIAAYYKKSLYVPEYAYDLGRKIVAADFPVGTDQNSAIDPSETLVLCPVPGR
jgi:hypothetical protein